MKLTCKAAYQRRMRRRDTQEESRSSHPLLDLSLSDLMNFRLVVGGKMSPVTLGPSVCLLLAGCISALLPLPAGPRPPGGLGLLLCQDLPTGSVDSIHPGGVTQLPWDKVNRRSKPHCQSQMPPGISEKVRPDSGHSCNKQGNCIY